MLKNPCARWQFRKNRMPRSEDTAGRVGGQVVTCTVTGVSESGLDVDVSGAPGFIRKSELSRDRGEQRTDRFATGEKIDAKVTQVDKGSSKILLSVKAREMEEEKKAVAEYGSTDSGASLGEILGAAIREKREAAERAEMEAERRQAKAVEDQPEDDSNTKS